MTEELTDRFGEPPKNVQNLLAVAELNQKEIPETAAKIKAGQ